jgi:hypothetical protein
MSENKSLGTGVAIAVPVLALLCLPLLILGSSSSLATAPPASGGQIAAGKVPAEYLAFVRAAGAKCPMVTAPVIAAQLDAESAWDPTAGSPAGAQGIAQFIPRTWATWGKDVNADGTASPFDPADAINAQGDFMCALAAAMSADLQLGVVKGDVLDLALAAYNAGPGAVEQFGGVPPFPETQAYVQRIRALMVGYTAPGSGVPLPGGQSTIVAAASTWLGTPYVWGGGGIGGPSGIGSDGRGPGFDCSGLTQYAVFAGASITLARTADAQIWDPRGKVVPRNFAQMQAGDIIGFSENGTGARGSFGHIGIYLGAGKMLDAPSTGKNVEIIDLQHDTYFGLMAWRILRFT